MASNSVTVCIRLRPFLPRETGPAVVQVNGNTVRIQVDVDQLYGAPEVEQRQFVFDLCLAQELGQEALYEQVGLPIFQNILAGFNGTLFAYGQTGSGKSFSVMGPDSNPGVIPRLTRSLFAAVEKDPRVDDPAKEIRISMSFLEIYNEELKDLLDPRPRQKKLYVHNHPKMGVYVPHLTEAAATSAAECLRLMDFGAKIRATAQTCMNSTSSRSHSVLTLRVTQVFPNGKIRNSSVNLCDLAGSERVKKTGAQGLRAREGSCINSSLSVLGQVISKLAAGAEKKGVHVPFRQSKLTHLLMDALSGNSVTTMLANVSPAHSEAEESMSTLRFAEGVKKVRTKPLLQELAPEEPAMLLETFKEEIDVLRQALSKEGTCLPNNNSQLSRAIEAKENLMHSFSVKTGTEWALAVEQTRALEVVQQQLLEDMRLSLHEVGQLAGVDSGTPYLLNISDDPALSGCLLYFLRSLPEISTVGQAGPHSIAPNRIQLQGLGIPARLCEIQYNADTRSVSIRKVCEESQKGRVMVNGRPLTTGVSTDLRHGDRIVFGWAFCFRLVIGKAPVDQGTESFETFSREMLDYSRSSTQGDMGMMRAAGHWQSELTRRNATGVQAEDLMAVVGELVSLVEEANMLCSEVQDAVPGTLPVELDVGLSFSFLSVSRLPSVVVQVWKRGEGRMIAAWPAADFDRRLNGLRDMHREVMKSRECHSHWAWRLSRDEWWAGGGSHDDDSAPASEAEDAPPESADSTAQLMSP